MVQAALHPSNKISPVDADWLSAAADRDAYGDGGAPLHLAGLACTRQRNGKYAPPSVFTDKPEG
jgi:hypothetical protein